jgi:hypothetical protein
LKQRKFDLSSEHESSQTDDLALKIAKKEREQEKFLFISSLKTFFLQWLYFIFKPSV